MKLMEVLRMTKSTSGVILDVSTLEQAKRELHAVGANGLSAACIDHVLDKLIERAKQVDRDARLR